MVIETVIIAINIIAITTIIRMITEINNNNNSTKNNR